MTNKMYYCITWREKEKSIFFYKKYSFKAWITQKKVNSKAKLLMQEFDEIKYLIIIKINQIKLSFVQLYQHWSWFLFNFDNSMLGLKISSKLSDELLRKDGLKVNEHRNKTTFDVR
jgi:hypothetical protein